MNSKPWGRRRFLTESAALAGLAVGAIRSASGQTAGSDKPKGSARDTRAYGERSHFEDSVRRQVWGEDHVQLNGFSDLYTPLQDLDGIITPPALHYTESHGYFPPDIDPRQHRLLIHGMVDRPLMFTLEELKSLPSVSRIHYLECQANSRTQRERKAESVTVQQTHGRTSCSEWTGVPVSLLLKEAGVQKGASWLVSESADPGNYTKSTPLNKVMADAIVAYSQSGEAVRPEQGYPLRMLVPGFEGLHSVKWLRRIKVVDRPYLGKWELRNFVDLRDPRMPWFTFEMGPKSVILRPAGGQRLAARGFCLITGLAWSGGGVIRRVEVSTDGGQSWKDAEIQQPALRHAHTRFRLAWNWDGEEAELQARATDELGQVQPSVAEYRKFWRTPPESKTDGFGHWNCIQPWKVARDGSVRNGLFA